LGVVWEGKEFIWAGDGKKFFRGVGERFIINEVFEEAFRKLLTKYKPPRRYKVGLFLPCSYGKPYGQSYIHYFIVKALGELGTKYNEVHQIIVSNVGVVPRELEEYTPFSSYDWNPAFETKRVKELYTRVLANRLEAYIQTFKSFYGAFACYLRYESDSYRSVRKVEGRINVKIPNLSLRRVPLEEVERVSLGIYKDEPDLVLITPSNLSSLVKRLREALA
jgi:predicted RNA-binding protein